MKEVYNKKKKTFKGSNIFELTSLQKILGISIGKK